MACDCIRSLEERTKEKTTTENPTWKIIEHSFANKALFFDKDAVIKIIVPIEVDYKFTKKNGELSRLNHAKVNMMATYCPFCGKAYEKVEVEDNPDTIFDLVQKLNHTEGLKSIEAKMFVMIHSNGDPNLLTIWSDVKGLKRPVAVGIELHVVVAVLETLTRLYTESPTVLDITKYDWRNYDGL